MKLDSKAAAMEWDAIVRLLQHAVWPVIIALIIIGDRRRRQLGFAGKGWFRFARRHGFAFETTADRTHIRGNLAEHFVIFRTSKELPGDPTSGGTTMRLDWDHLAVPSKLDLMTKPTGTNAHWWADCVQPETGDAAFDSGFIFLNGRSRKGKPILDNPRFREWMVTLGRKWDRVSLSNTMLSLGSSQVIRREEDLQWTLDGALSLAAMLRETFGEKPPKQPKKRMPASVDEYAEEQP